MLRRALATSSKAISSSARTVAQRPLARSQIPPAPLNPLRTTLSARTRWYSAQTKTAEKEDATETKSSEETTPEAEAKESQDAEAPSSVEAELKKKLEAKEREAIDWKVRNPRCHIMKYRWANIVEQATCLHSFL